MCIRDSVLDPTATYPNPAAVNLLTEKFVRARHAIPVDFRDDAIVLAMVNPLDVVTIDDLRIITGKNVIPAVATATGMADAIDLFFDGKSQLNLSLIHI